MAIKFSRETLKGLTKTNGDFHLSHRFGLEIDGITIGGIHKVDGIEFEAEVVEYNDGEDAWTHCRPGVLKPGRITVERDFSSTKEFYSWRKEVNRREGQPQEHLRHLPQRQGRRGEAAQSLQLLPAKWHGPALNSKSSGHATERLEIVFEECKFA